MSVSKWAYTPEMCDGDICVGDCDLCDKPKIAEMNNTATTQVQTDYIEREYDEWCTDCKEYDKERHCCPRWNKVIRDTVDEIRQNADVVEVVRCKDCKWRNGSMLKCNTYSDNDYCSYGERAEA